MSTEASKILLIEDSAADAALVQRLLDQLGDKFSLTHASCFEDAKEALSAQRFEFAITDLGLPDCNRQEPIAYLRQQFAETAIIALSGDECESLYVDSIKFGADDFICKNSLDLDRLRRSLHQSKQRVQEKLTVQKLVDEVERQNVELEKKSFELEAKNRRLRVLCDSSRVFVNHVSHEFRTPLCVIKQYASLLSDAVIGPLNAEQVRMLRVMEDRVDGLNNLVDDMLDVSRHEAGLLSARRSSHSAAKLIENEIDALRQRASIRKIIVDLQLDRDLPNVFCDGEKAERTLVNLVTNAIKYSPVESCITVRAALNAEGDAVQVDVRDEGIGIPADKIQNLFGRFQQDSSGLQCETKGFGLGLGIAKELAELNLGTIEVESTPQLGSQFSFTLPLDQDKLIVARFIRYVRQRQNRGSNELSIVRVEYNSANSKRQREAVRTILSFVLRSNDILTTSTDTSSLVVLNAGEAGTLRFIERLQSEIEQSSRNCLTCDLPEVCALAGERLDLHADTEWLTDQIISAGNNKVLSDSQKELSHV